MEALTKKQLEAIERVSGMIIDTRSQLAEALCEALGDGYTWANGFVNGHGNSIVLYFENTPIQIGTYRFKDPKSVAIKYMFFGQYAYNFDYYGKVTAATRSYEERIGNTIYVRHERII